jgi:hypothetical protein
MWWFWYEFLAKSDKIVSSKFYLSALCTFILQIQPNTTSHTVLTSTPYFVFPGSYILNYRQPHHGIVASSSDSSLGCKLTWISVENVHTEAVFWISFQHRVFPGLFCDLSHTVHYFLPFTVLSTCSSINFGTSKLLTWRSCGAMTVTVQNFSFTIIRHHTMYLHITHPQHRCLS